MLGEKNFEDNFNLKDQTSSFEIKKNSSVNFSCELERKVLLMIREPKDEIQNEPWSWN